MARRLILDTNVLIDAQRRPGPSGLITHPDDDAVIASVTVAELRAGVELSTGSVRSTRSAFVDEVLAVLPVEWYESATAQAHAELLAHARRSGTPRGAHDLIIAATALSTGRMIMTGDRRARFGDLPGVGVARPE